MSTPTGIHLGISNDAYHQGPGVSRSTLWTIHTKTPAHTKAERKETSAMSRGSAVDDALLDPEGFELRYIRGPEDRRGNKWVEAMAEAHNTRRVCLTAGDYDKALEIRDGVMANPQVLKIVTGNDLVRGASGLWRDEATNVLCKCRPDIWRPSARLMVDLKTTKDASVRGFSNSVARYGYHAQEAWYTEGWQLAGGGEVAGFLFIAVEPDAPYESAVYEIEPRAVEKGRQAMRQALTMYAACLDTGYWPGYPQMVTAIDIPSWAYGPDAAYDE